LKKDAPFPYLFMYYGIDVIWIVSKMHLVGLIYVHFVRVFGIMNTYVSAAAFLERRKILVAALLVFSVLPLAGRAQSAAPAPMGGARVTGRVTGMVGPTVQITRRDGRTVAVNLRVAKAHDLVPQVYPGEFLQIQGSMTGAGTMTAAAVMRAKSAPSAWPADIP